MLDEAPVAFVIAAAGVDPAALSALIEATCKETLADFKRPHEVRMVEDMPRSTLEKVAKAQLRSLLNAG